MDKSSTQIDVTRSLEPMKDADESNSDENEEAKCTLLGRIDDLINRLQRENTHLASMYIVLLYAIPLCNRKGERNNQWRRCTVRFWHNHEWKERSMQLVYEDTVSHDRIFRGILLRHKKAEGLPSLSFYVEDADSDDHDLPFANRRQNVTLDLTCPDFGPKSCYKILSRLTSLRDGESAKNDRLSALGICIMIQSSNTTHIESSIVRYFEPMEQQWKEQQVIVVRKAVMPQGLGNLFSEIIQSAAETELTSDIYGFALFLTKRSLTFKIQKNNILAENRFHSSQKFHVSFSGFYLVSVENLESSNTDAYIISDITAKVFQKKRIPQQISLTHEG